MLSRRQFLLAAGAAVTTANVRADAPAGITFGFSLYGMRGLELDRALEACAKIGYDAVELPTMPGWHAEPSRLNADQRRRLRQRLRDLKLTCPALMENLPLDGDDKLHRVQLDRLEKVLELSRDLDAEHPPLVETILGGPVGQWDKLKQAFVTRLGDWAQLAGKHRVLIAVKPHRGNAMNLPEHALWLLHQVNSPWIRLAYDYSHFQFRELTLEGTLKDLLPSTRFMHVKDVRLDQGRMQFLLPGEGTIDYPALLKGLSDGGYRGSVCVEVSGMIHTRKDYDPLAAAARCFTNLAPAFAKAGIRRSG